jgi:peptidoglycan/xylan/chitin deacetylase (PgdA/CDA1 family)/SAM-dependent methyltransferase
MPESEARLDGERQEYWESFFRAHEDPWQYDNPYETTKYEQTLALLPRGSMRNALELACAEGHFTARLAARVDRLIAADVSTTALQRARARCGGISNVEFRVIDFLSADLPQGLDLIVCSEVLYYASPEQLAHVPAKLAAALAPDGYLLMAHAHTIGDERSRTGFDWGDLFGAKTIADTFATCAALGLTKELRTELYHIQLFQRTEPNRGPLPPPELIRAELAASLPADVERAVIWGGATTTRAEALEREYTDQIPILMYHSIAEDGPPELCRFRLTPNAFREQLRYLRRHGYYSISIGEWARCIASRERLRGRPVAITFDDGYRDFLTEAAPLLEAADFSATVFVVAGKVGAAADWDSSSWPPLRLMDWNDLRDLQRRGFEIGSHTTWHTDLRTLSEEDILHDCQSARAVLRKRLGYDVNIISLPWGFTDARIRAALARDGWRAAVTTQDGRSSLADDPLDLPRIEIVGDEDVDSFARVLKEGRNAAQGGGIHPDGMNLYREPALLRERLRAAEGEALLQRKRAEFAEAEAAAQRLLAEASGRSVGELSEQLEQALVSLRTIESSTIWRTTAPLRSWFGTRPRLARVARRSAKLLWWSVTLRFPEKVKERLARGRAHAVFGARQPATAGPEVSIDGAPPAVEPSPAADPNTVVASLSFPSVGASLLSDIPLLIPTFNNVTYLRGMIAQLRTRGLQNLIVVDNASSAADMQELLSSIAATAKVVRLSENLGPRHAFLSEAAFRWLPDIFCLTDPDLAFHPDLPGEFLEELVDLTERFRVGKAGFALDIADRSALLDEPVFDIDGKSYRIWEWEEQFWQEEIGVTRGGDPVYRAPIDTTFAVYNKNYFDLERPLQAVRVAGNYTCRHLPWYKDCGIPTAEAETYRATQKFSSYMLKHSPPERVA